MQKTKEALSRPLFLRKPVGEEAEKKKCMAWLSMPSSSSLSFPPLL